MGGAKDVDVLITIGDGMDLTRLAHLGRQLKGGAQQINRGADVFLATAAHGYIGRTCHWRVCERGIRVSCYAQHCGRWHYLRDDLGTVTLDHTLVTEPPIELWPHVVVRVASVPEDVERLLLKRARPT